jgi:hypothetical protein
MAARPTRAPVFYDWLGTANASFSTVSVLGPKGWLPHSSVTPPPVQVSNGVSISFDAGDDGMYFAIPFALNAGDLMTGMFKVIVPTGCTVMAFLYQGSTGAASADSLDVVGDGTEKTVSVQWVLPNAMASGDLRFYLWCRTATGSKNVVVTGSTVVQGDYDGAVFDGDSAIVEDGLWHGWTGTANDSTSEERACLVYGRTEVTAQWTRRRWLVI